LLDNLRADVPPADIADAGEAGEELNKPEFNNWRPFDPLIDKSIQK